MTKSVASLLFLVGAVSLAGACSSTDDGPTGGVGGTGNNTSGSGSIAGTGNGQPTAGGTSVAGSGNPAGGSTGQAGGTGSMAGSGTGGAGSVAGAGGTGTAGAAGNGAGGAGMAGNGAGGGGNPGNPPPGFWKEKDWQGCSWVAKGTAGTTTITPADFVAKPAAEAFCMKGTVGKDAKSESVALLGFNIAQPAPASCAAGAAPAVPPGAVAPTAEGLAVNFVKQGANTAFTWRVQVEGTKGDGSDRWCATVTEVQGKVFVPWSSFTPKCWAAAAERGTPYAKQPISQVSFTVPGNSAADVPFDVCVNGFTYGASAADAPDGPAMVGDQTGTVGVAGGADNTGDFKRAKVVVGGKQYIIQNNNWGSPLSTDLILTYKNNSFVVTSGMGSGGDAPASFPSIYIGNNGETGNGVYSTKGNDKLPIQIKSITSLPSTLRYKGTTSVFNATYDIWFSNTIPNTKYDDGIDGFVMVWLRDPTGKQPIGSKMAQVMVAGQAWDVWVGPRGNGPAGPNDAPVVSFVNPVENDDSRAQTFKNVDLKAFFTAAAAYGIGPDMYLTDVFGGFEIWQGGSGGNLAVEEFTAVVNP